MITDAAPVKGIRRTADGYLVADAKVARVGVQVYRSKELGLPGKDRAVRAYRPESEVFNRDSIKSFANRPVTIEHPSEPVTADNWKDVAIGQTGAEVVRDGEFVRVPILIMDAKAIADIESGRRELSMGYTAEVVDGAGMSPNGQEYDVQLLGLRMNHLAVVRKARGGKELRIGDGADNRGAAPTGKKDRAMTTKTVVLGDAAVQVAVSDAEKIEQFKAAMTKRVTDAEAKAAKTEEELEDEKRKSAEMEDEKNKYKEMADAATDPAKLSKLVADRAVLQDSAGRLVSGMVFDGLTDNDIRRKAVAAVLGDAAVADVADAEVSGMFRALVASRGNDSVRSALKDSAGQVVNDSAGWERAAKAANVKLKQ